MRSGDGSKRVRLPWTTPEALNVLLRAFMGSVFRASGRLSGVLRLEAAEGSPG